jgi:tetratricopeptide (TPR) repeat protein
VWQEVRTELRPRGLEIVTVALDTDPEAARPWIVAAQPDHPALIDRTHLVDELFGIVNVPSSVWIDESGTIVRPPETAFAKRPAFLDRVIPPDATPRQAARMAETKKMRVDAEGYMAALRDWVERGAESRFALSPEEVLHRSRPRPIEEATAAAHFELGQHLYQADRTEDAIRHFREAHRLQPDNWTYKRQAWTLADPDQGPTEIYDGDWLTDVQKSGAENYYLPFEP